VHGVLFTPANKQHLATVGKASFEDRRERIPMGDKELRADLHKLRKESGPTGNVRFVADSDSSGHADRAWAGFLATCAAKNGPGVIDYESSGQRVAADVEAGIGAYVPLTDDGFGTVAGGNDFGGYG
jgi:phage FluMu gp28-like protein